MYVSLERSPEAQNPDAKSRGTLDKAIRLRHVERHAGPNPPQLNGSLDVLAKEQSHRITDFLSGHAAFEDGKREHRGDYHRRRRILFAGFVTRMEEGDKAAEVRDVRRTGGGRKMRGSQEKSVDGVFPG